MRYTLFLAAICLTGKVLAGDFANRFEEIKRSVTPAELYTFLYALPKGGDLHNHLGGAGRAEWWYAIATDPVRNGGDTFYTRVRFSSSLDPAIPVIAFHTIRKYTFDRLDSAEQADYRRLDQLNPAQKQAWLDSVRLDRMGEGRDEFFNAIWPRMGDLFRNMHVCTGILWENLHAFGAEGLRYLETQFSVQRFYDNQGKPIPTEDAFLFVKQLLQQPHYLQTGVTVRFQETVLRFVPDAEQQVQDLYTFVDTHRDLWVGLNMAGIEENGHGHPARFLDKFREMRRTHPTLPLSIHAGEMDGPDSHIRDTLLLGASRIGHGVNLIMDPDTLLLLQQSRRVLVEINLISNRLLEYTPDLMRHPFPEYLRTGVPVCLNTDDRGIWDSNLTDEYYTAVTTFNLSWNEVVQLGRNSLRHAFVQSDVKKRLLADYDRAVAEFETNFLPADSLTQLAAIRPVTYGYAARTWGFEFP